ncbi:MAG: hypothetical protein ACJ72N_22010 [Labedaea sp.]
MATMARRNVFVPDELEALVRDQLPGLNVSALLQDALRARLACRHDELECARCGHRLDHAGLVDQAVGRFYADVVWEVGELVRRSAGATAEGAARVIKRVAADKGVSEVAHQPLPRPARPRRRPAAAA